MGSSFQQDILKRISEQTPVYVVGGAVRDRFSSIPSKDVDAVTTLSIVELERKLVEMGYSPHVIGANQPTVSLFQGNERLDIATFAGDLKEDALHRDFTLNAIFMDVRTGEILDPLNGLQDLREKRLKACGRAMDRFREDPLRMLRMIRFATGYGFEIAEQTWQAAVDHISQLRVVASERVTVELGRILILADVDKALGLLDGLGYFQYYLPELARLKGLVQNRYHTKDAWEHTRQVVKNTPQRVLLRLAALLHDLGKWETASRECLTWGTIQESEQGYKVDQYQLIGKNIERWLHKYVEVRGGLLDNEPDTIVVKRISPAWSQQERHFEMVPEGKRHFLQHESASARMVEEILPRFRWSMVLPGGSNGEKELKYIVGHHMLGTLAFMNDLTGKEGHTKLITKARRFAWEIGWNGQFLNTQRVNNLLDLWRADFLGGKQDAQRNLERLDEIQSHIRMACSYFIERADRLDWSHFHEFAQSKGLVGKQFGRYKEQVRCLVMMNTKHSLKDPLFLEREYNIFQNSK